MTSTADRLLEVFSGGRLALFLDRDGVINRRVEGDYVRTWSQFEFLPGVLGAISRLTVRARYAVVITNQQGVGKGLMSQDGLDTIHRQMLIEMTAAGGQVGEVLSCPHLASSGCECRKPRPQLVREWLCRHPDVSVADCVMVGDSRSDMDLARFWPGGSALSVFVGAHHVSTDPSPPAAVVSSLVELADLVSEPPPLQRVAL